MYTSGFNYPAYNLFSSNFRHFSSESQHLKLNACTLRNLEVFRNQSDGGEKGTLVWMLDHTRTRFGGRRLRQWLARPLASKM